MAKKKISIYDEPKLDVIEIFPRVYHVTCDSRFDLAMTFLRSQEFYESDNPEVRGKDFLIIEYMRWYARRNNNASTFTYPKDWAGFNVPSAAIKKALASVYSHEWNLYDSAMENLIQELPAKFYLIGTMRHRYDNELYHEIAHAFYYLSRDYKEAMGELLSSMSNITKERVHKELKRRGYAKKVWDDETQAYMIAGITTLNPLIGGVAGRKKFKKIFADKVWKENHE